ncbi:MAG: PEP-CTERM sorting domain-containing protein [Pirellulales bacterium]|nr:PEP-CTERM sorting domain-containing protein [Pirellulales bacterium]
MISKRVLLTAALLLAVSATGAMAASVNVNNFNVALLSIGATDYLNLNSTASYGIVGGTVTTPTPTPYATVYGYVLNGFAGGAWNGVGGINSSVAAADPLTATTIAIASGDDVMNVVGQSTFYGHTNALTDSLMRYTYYGDCDLNGVTDLTDYGYIDYAYLSGGLSGWVWGDFDMDGSVGLGDYGYIDYVYLSGLPSLGPSTASAAAAAVPEPSTVILLISSTLCAFIVYLRKR